MARIDTLQNFLTDLADKFRQYMGGTNKLPHKNFDTYIDYVYGLGKDEGDHAGYTRGVDDGKATGYMEGKQAEYDAFWDIYQRNGTRTNYCYAFAGDGWCKDNFKPKYPIVPSATWGAMGMFFHFGLGYSDVLDFREIAHWFDFSVVDRCSNLFNSAKINHIEIDLSNANNLDAAFGCDWSRTGRTHLTLKVSEKCTSYGSTFAYCGELTHLFFMEGSKIAAGVSVVSATALVKESIESVIAALWDGASGKTLTLSRTAVTNAFGSTDSDEWKNLIATKSNWTITLA